MASSHRHHFVGKAVLDGSVRALLQPIALVPRASLMPINTNTNRNLLIKLARQLRNAKEVTVPGAASTTGG